ncbi:MAG: extracellular solute-binding protein [Sphaerochaetaceae bacterium]
MMKKTIILVFSLLLVCSTVFAGGATEKVSGKKEQKIVSTVCCASYANEGWYLKMNADFEQATGIHVDVQPTPGNDDDHVMKVNIDLLAGGTVDVVQSLGPKNYYNRVEAGYLMPLKDLVAKAGVDATAVWGSYLPVDKDGEFYAVPLKQELYCVFYNKNIFDNAGVPYPSGPWTWDEYLATARKLTNPAKGIYGSFMNADNPWQFLPARQRNIDLYKADGTCNFDDPAFAEAAAWYYDLGNSYKVQPSVSELLADNASWNYYALEGDHLAMFPQGNWFTRLLNSQTDYPKDWKYGVAPMPSASKDGSNNFVSMAYSSVNKNAAHPEEALAYVLWLGENQWKYEGGIPALASLTQEEQNQVFSSIADASSGQVTVSDLYENMMNTGLGVAQSDIIGPAASEYNAIVNEELQAYCMNLQPLDKAISRIVSRVNEAIKNTK